jgi:hypothetical protein
VPTTIAKFTVQTCAGEVPPNLSPAKQWARRPCPIARYVLTVIGPDGQEFWVVSTEPLMPGTDLTMSYEEPA